MLKIDNIRVTVDNKEVVKGVSLAIKPGEIHALMGPNGSGKSSLAMAVIGHPAYKVAPKESSFASWSTSTPAKSDPSGFGRTNGFSRRENPGPSEKSRIELDGVDISDKTPDERARLGLFLAMQYPVGIGGVTVEQLLRRSVQEPLKGPTLPRQGRTLSDTRIDVLQFRKDLEKLAKKVGVKPELLHRSINVGFSGGEKKRLEILQMLVLKPKYAILDETDSGLDIDALRMIAKNIRLFANSKLKTPASPAGRQISNPQLKTQNCSGILIITHYARLLKHLQPDYVHIMKEGKITETGGKELAERIEKNGYR